MTMGFHPNEQLQIRCAPAPGGRAQPRGRLVTAAGTEASVSRKAGTGVRRSGKRSQSKMRVFALLPFAVFGLVFAAYPMIQVVRMAFSDVQIQRGGFIWEFNGTANLERVLRDGAAWQAFGNTILFVVLTVVFSLVIGLVLALLVDRAVMMLPLARNVLVWPAVVAPVIVSLMWLLILSPTAGGLNKVLGTFGIPGQGWLATETGAMASVVIVDVWHWTPVVFLFLYTALKSIDESTLEAARMDGAHEMSIIRHIVLPLLAPAIGAVIIVRVIMGVKAFDEMYLLTRGGPNGSTTLVTQHIKTLFFDNLQLGTGSAFSMLIVVLTALLLGVFLFVRSRKENKA
jgi:multiple sugar transport system permease protein